MVTYLRRLIKFLAYILFFFILILGIIPLILYDRSLSESFNELIMEQRFIIVISLLIAYSFFYPVLGFIRLKRHVNGSFADNRTFFEEAFQTLNYIKTEESGSRIVYRKKSTLTRLFYFMEDKVILYTDENPVIISGIRKAVYRINRKIEQALMKAQPL